MSPVTWPIWAALLPHLLTQATTTLNLNDTLRRVQWYLLVRGDHTIALADILHEHWRNVLGPDHLDTLRIARQLAFAHHRLRNYQKAYDLHQATHQAMLRILGPDHPDTLDTAHSLANDLRALNRVQEAESLEIDIRDRRLRVEPGDGPGPEAPSSSSD